VETLKAIRGVWPLELPLFVRLSSIDWIEGGWSLPDTIRLARILSSLGVDAIDCSSGGIASQESINPYPGYQVPFSEAVRREARCKTVAVGMISEATFAEEIISGSRADLVAIGRVALWDAYWPYRAAKRLGVDFQLPVQYARSKIFAY
jgi:2,4-dienoyl-CoA reductase-like NADH-dependent reductase (Old Yellow Enzyme family)